MNRTLVLLAAICLGSLPLRAAVTISTLQAGPPPKVRVFKTTTAGEQLRLYYFLPPDFAPGQARPAVVWIHGGGWIAGTLAGFMPHARYTAARGAVGFNIEYRLLKPAGPFISDCIADCKSAVRYIRAHAAELGVDPHRIAVAGDSAGGHLAAALGTLEGFDDPSDDLAVSARPDAMILYNPIVDLTEGNWIRFAVAGAALADRQSPRPATPGDLQRARDLSPLFHVRAGQPPALLIHGLADTVVTPDQARRFAAAARAAGNRCDLILVPDTGHAFAVAYWKYPESSVVAALRDTDRFLSSLGYFRGGPPIEPSSPPAWQPRSSSPAASPRP